MWLEPSKVFSICCVMLNLELSATSAYAQVCISEFLADNESGIKDEDGTRQDWIELYNSGDAAVCLDGWWLTDKASNATEWQIPAVTISAKGTLFFWASGKNRTKPSAPLHTNFSLSKNGEYLGLYKPDPTNGLPVLIDAFSPSFPALPADVSYGRMFAQASTTFVASGEVGRYRVPMGALEYTGTVYAAGQMGQGQPGGWNVSSTFDDSMWTNAATGVGYDTTGGFWPWIGTSPSGDCSNVLYKVNSSLCFRRLFYVAVPTNLASMTLRMKYEDGFVAYVNGHEVGRANCTNAMAYNTKANTYIDESVINSWTDYVVSNQWLAAGTNLLAVQGLNSASTSSDFLLLPEMVGEEPEVSSTPVYFSTPTPDALNGSGTTGPLLYNASPEDPDVPRPLGKASSPPLKVTVHVLKTRNNVAAVRAYYRTMWIAESAAVTLLDNGVSPDAVSNDAVYTVSLPTTGPAPGQMFRWRFEALDVSNTVTKLPAYADTNNAPQYYGTVAVDTAIVSSQIPVLEWFVQSTNSCGPTLAAFRGSCYFLSNFYDNVGHDLHGQSTRNFAKKSYNFGFNSDFSFLWNKDERRVKNVNLLSNFADKTKTRNTFSHWVGMETGTPNHFAFPVRVQLDGVFHGVMDLVEDGGDRMLERNGLDPDGALYKIYNIDLATAAEKKTREEENNADLAAFTNGLNTVKALTNRQTYAYDNVDIAATVNYLVTRQLNSDGDHGHKNMYLYRDSNVTREWQPIIWDVDLSQGHNWTSTKAYFDDYLYYTNPLNQGANNRLYDIVWESLEMRQMFVRRMRTLMDTLMQPPGTTNGFFETRMREIVNTVDPDPADPSPWTDGDLDVAHWSFPSLFSTNRAREEVERVVTNYFPLRRAFLFNTGSGRPTYNGVNIPDLPQTNKAGIVVIDSLDFLPAGGTQSNEYVILRNTTSQAVDISGWQVKGQIDYTFKGGTVIPAGAGTAATNYVGLLHVVKDAYAFRLRTSGPTGGQRRFVQGNYSGQLSARGGVVNLYDATNLLIAACTYAGTPLPSQQDLRVTEIQYHPVDPSAAESAALVGVTDDDFEYVELANIGTPALTLTGDYFAQGIDYTFPVSILAGGERLILAKNPTAFAFRYPSVSVPIYGPYGGVLDNGGEKLELTDVCGENILSFEYKDGWYPATDGTGRSLVLRDTATAYDAYGEAASWGISKSSEGEPGATVKVIAQSYYGWDNFHFTGAEREDDLVSGPYADPDGDGRVNWVEYALGSDPWVSDVDPIELSWVTSEKMRFAALSFRRPINALDVKYSLQATSDLVNEAWSVSGNAVLEASPLSNEKESAVLYETNAVTASARFFRLWLNFEGE